MRLAVAPQSGHRRRGAESAMHGTRRADAAHALPDSAELKYFRRMYDEFARHGASLSMAKRGSRWDPSIVRAG